MYYKEIQMKDIVNFCDDYNAIGYGEAEIIELRGKIIVKLYNAGFSENEEKDTEFRDNYKDSIIYDRHPIIIAEFSTLPLKYGTKIVGFENLKDWCDCYSKKNEFKFEIEIS